MLSRSRDTVSIHYISGMVKEGLPELKISWKYQPSQPGLPGPKGLKKEAHRDYEWVTIEIVMKMNWWGSAPNPDKESSAAPEGRPGGGSFRVDAIVQSYFQY